jgi:catechol 2,3-dioxygenase-like lactoylglutathione lyase family enzyme
MQRHDLAIPILPSRNVKDTSDFYHLLGFEGGQHEFNSDYAILKRGDIELHFFTFKELDPSKSYAGCYLRVQDVESIYACFTAAKLPKFGIPRIDVLEDKPWGLKEFAVVDPSGNLLRIGQVI